MTTRPVLLSPADTAHLLGRPIGTVKRWAHEGRLTSHDGRYDWMELRDVAAGRITCPPRLPTPRSGRPSRS
ncbi:protein of unknown function [Streptantibioticus cattleyicolor NRRL 8057 = DSM 46488]|nr:protein of unknown function [Streptantibioticus cattleyicolor NRRL 8057 = DSM 46488]